MKKRIRLTESDLHKIVKESVKRVLTETKAMRLNEYECYEDPTLETIQEILRKDPSRLSDSELLDSIQYMLHYRDYLDEYGEDVLHSYIEEEKNRGLDV